ncbi:MAG: hypothetical protein V4819_15545 [Verrucomicrobiota bacterium]
MKPSSFIPPVVALILAGVWLGPKYRSVSAAEAMNSALRSHINVAGLNTPADEHASRFIASSGAVDWGKLAGQLPKSLGVGKSRALRLFEARWELLEPGEMSAALQQIDALDLSTDDRKALERFLMSSMMKKDPGLGLSWVVGHSKDGKNSADYAHYFKNWASKDLTKATEWLDREIAAGKFDSFSLDGKNEARSGFELELIRLLIPSNPAAAGHRLSGMPVEQRGEVLQDYSLSRLKGDDQLAFVKLVRDHLPADEQIALFAWQSSRLMSEGDLPDVANYLELIHASPKERAVCAEKVAVGKFKKTKHLKPATREDLDALREWVNSQAPGSADAITGTLLGEITSGVFAGKPLDSQSKTSFAVAAALATGYNDASGNDAVLVNLLQSFPAIRNRDQSRVLAAKILDENLRETMLRKFK